MFCSFCFSMRFLWSYRPLVSCALPSKSGWQNNSHTYILLHMYLQHTPTISVLVSRRIKLLESILIPRLSSPQLIHFSNKPIHYHYLGFCCNLLMTCSVKCVCDGFRAVHWRHACIATCGLALKPLVSGRTPKACLHRDLRPIPEALGFGPYTEGMLATRLEAYPYVYPELKACTIMAIRTSRVRRRTNLSYCQSFHLSNTERQFHGTRIEWQIKKTQ